MSAEAYFWAWLMDVKPSTAKYTLLCLADYHNADTGRCDPSAHSISTYTGLNKKTVPEALDVLIRSGLVEMHLRPGTSPRYILRIAENPAPQRGEDKRRPKPIPKPVLWERWPRKLKCPACKKGWVTVLDSCSKCGHSIRPTPKTGIPNIGVGKAGTTRATNPETGYTQNRGIPENGVTRNRGEGVPEIGVGGYPEIGEGVYPKSGYEPTNNLPENLPVTDQQTEPYGSAAGAARAVDNSVLNEMGRFYDHPGQGLDQPAPNMITVGVDYMLRRGVEERRAWNVLRMFENEHGRSALTDALLECVIWRPAGDPVAYLRQILNKPRKPIPADWEPAQQTVGNVIGLGMNIQQLKLAHGYFLTWHSERGTTSNDWNEYFERWCAQDLERAEHDHQRHLAWLAQSAGLTYQPEGMTA